MATGDVVTVKLAVVLPAGIVTLAGTLPTDGFALAIVTDAPPAGAACVSVTVPVEVVPPKTVAGLSARELIAGKGITVNVAELELPL